MPNHHHSHTHTTSPHSHSTPSHSHSTQDHSHTQASHSHSYTDIWYDTERDIVPGYSAGSGTRRWDEKTATKYTSYAGNILVFIIHQPQHNYRSDNILNKCKSEQCISYRQFCYSQC